MNAHILLNNSYARLKNKSVCTNGSCTRPIMFELLFFTLTWCFVMSCLCWLFTSAEAQTVVMWVWSLMLGCAVFQTLTLMKTWCCTGRAAMSRSALMTESPYLSSSFRSSTPPLAWPSTAAQVRHLSHTSLLHVLLLYMMWMFPYSRRTCKSDCIFILASGVEMSHWSAWHGESIDADSVTASVTDTWELFCL